MVKYLVTFIITICSFFICNAQQHTKAIIDSLKKLNQEEQIIFLHYTFGNNPYLINDADSLQAALQILKSTQWSHPHLKDHILYYERIAPTILEKNLDKRIALLTDILNHTPYDDRFYPVILHQVGMNYYINKQHAKGLEYLLKAKNRFNEVGYHTYPEAGVYLHDLALIYHTFKEYKECISLMHKALGILPFSANLAIQRFNTLSSAYAQIKQDDSAIYYSKATYYEAKHYNDTTWMIIASLNISYATTEKIDTALMNKILRIDDWTKGKNIADDIEIFILYNKIKLFRLKSLLKHQDIAEADRIVQKINLHPHLIPEKQAFQSHIRDRAYLKLYYESFREYYLAKQNFKEALRFTDSANKINTEIDKSYNELIVNVANDQLSISQGDYALQRLELKRKNNILIFSTITLLLSGILVFILYKKSKKEKLAIALQLKSDHLQYQVAIKNKELQLAQQSISLSLNKITEKNEIIDKIQAELDKLQAQKPSYSNEISALEGKIAQLKETRILTEEDWIEFQKNYATINKELFDNLRTVTPKLTEAEIRYLMLVSLELTNKDIANILGISPDSLRVTWNRIKKKFPNQHFENAKQMLQSIDTLLDIT